MQSGCQADCHVSHWERLLWASGCFGVYFKSTDCQHENTSRFPNLFHLSCSALLSLLLLGISCRHLSHERDIQGGAESLSSGGEMACLQGRSAGETEVKCSSRDGHRSQRHRPDDQAVRGDGRLQRLHHVSNTRDDPEKVNTRFSQQHKGTGKFHSLSFSPFFSCVVFIFCTPVSTVSITSCSLCL